MVAQPLIHVIIPSLTNIHRALRARGLFNGWVYFEQHCVPICALDWQMEITRSLSVTDERLRGGGEGDLV